MNKTQSKASWVKITNPDGWWAQYPKPCSNKFNVIRQSRCGFTTRRNHDGVTRLATSMRDIWTMWQPNCRFQQLSSPKQTWLQHNHHQHSPESLRRLSIPSLEHCKFPKRPHDQKVANWCCVPRNHCHTNALGLSHLIRCLICHWTRYWSLFNLYPIISG